TIDHRDCETDSIDAAVAEAKYWLVQTQKNAPARGVTHYRVVGENGTAIGGPPSSWMRHGSIVAGPSCYHNLRLIDLSGHRNEDGRFVAPKRIAGGGRACNPPRPDRL